MDPKFRVLDDISMILSCRLLVGHGIVGTAAGIIAKAE